MCHLILPSPLKEQWEEAGQDDVERSISNNLKHPSPFQVVVAGRFVAWNNNLTARGSPAFKLCVAEARRHYLGLAPGVSFMTKGRQDVLRD